ncbi:MAG: LamG-like jellyroll fold domain-containing protein, partial [Gemmatimonadales bacterium]
MRLTTVLIPLAGFGLFSPLPADLVSHWTLDGDLLDSGPAGNHGTMLGAPSPTFVDGFDGAPGGAVSFDGVDDLIQVAHTSGLPISAQPAFTVAMWVKGAPQRDKRVFSESTTTNAPLFNLGTDSAAAPTAKVDIFIRNDANTAIVNHKKSDRNGFDGQWRHLAWVDDNGKAVLYLDGIRDAVDFTYPRGT